MVEPSVISQDSPHSTGERRHRLSELVRAELRAFVGLRPTDAIPADTAFLDLGFDSLRAVDFKTVLEARLGTPLRSTVLYDCPTVGSLVEFLLGEDDTAAAPTGGVRGETAPSLDPHEMSREALLAALLAARAELDRQHAPIAIVGMACRFPGAPDLETFWRLQLAHGDAIVPIPRERWAIDAWYDADPATPGKMAVREGGFIDGIDQFDAAFFNLSPREARALDPQQRLLLEVAWQSLEHAGIAPDALAGVAAGVFIGLRESEYFITAGRHDPKLSELYVGTGNALSTAAGRISFTLGLTGPALSVDTACSSSLAAVHLAVSSLRRGETRLALAGGVNVLLDPLGMVGLSRGGMLSPDSRCKTFAAGANGYVRSEGAGMVVLKRLADAEADGDRVLGVILGAATNQDGQSGGLTVPYGPAQEAVIRAALADGRVSPAEVSYVEAHGTGTALGDPIEIGALDRVFRGRSAPLSVGTIKTNIGHLETAAGIAGLIRTVLALGARTIPPIRSLDRPSPHIAWDEICAAVATRAQPWVPSGARRVAGVSSFGFSGTNAHVVVGEAPEVAPPPPAEPAEDVLFLSASSEAALAATIERHRAHFAALDDARFADACYTSRAGRAQLEHRLAVTASHRADLVRRLERVQEGAQLPGVMAGRAAGDPPRIAFLFTGQGAQYAGMGRDLAQTSPVFAAALDRAGAALLPHLGFPIAELLWGDRSSELGETHGAQPALFAVEYALAELWRSMGVVPTIVLGHSVGELAASVCAGLLSVEDAAALVAARGRLMTERTPPGAMITVFAGESVVAPLVAPFGEDAAISGYNGPASLTVAGTPAAIEALSAALAEAGVSSRKVIASRAFHTPQMRPMLRDFEAVLERTRLGRPAVEMVSTVDPGAGTAAFTERTYFSRQILAPVRFSQGLAELAHRGVTSFLEIGPRPTLSTLGKDVLGDAAVAFVPSMRPGKDGRSQILEALGTLWARGLRVDGRRVFAEGRRKVELPSYPFQRRRYWYEGAAEASAGAVHPLLGARIGSPALDAERVEHQSLLSSSSPGWLADHAVGARVVFPAAGYVELALAALHQVSRAEGAPSVSGLRIAAPLVLEASATPLSTALVPDGRQLRLEIAASSPEDARWTTHASAGVESVAREPRRIDVAALSQRIGTAVDVGGFYAALAALGLPYGPAFRGVERLWVEGHEALARVRLPEGAGTGEGYLLHPALLDACFQVSAAVLQREGVEERALPVAIERVTLRSPAPAELVCHVVRRETAGARSVVLDLVIASAAGEVVVDVSGLELLRLGDEGVDGAQLLQRSSYVVDWRRVPLDVAPQRTGAKVWLVPDAGGVGTRLATVMSAQGARVDAATAAPAEAPDTIVVAATLDARAADLRAALAPLLAMAQRSWPSTPRVYVLSAPAEGAAQAAIAGFLASWGAEDPGPRPTRIELPAQPSDAEVAAAAREVLADDAETAVRLGEDERRVARLARGLGHAFPSLDRGAVERPWMLRTRGYGQLQNLRLVPLERRAPGPGEVEVALDASALNFRDVLHAMGMLETYARAYGVTRAEEQPFGFDAVGRVTRVGEGAALSEGARVFLLGFGTCASHMTLDARQVALAPTSLSDADVAAAPTAYLTALLGLLRLARLQRGETVLIHGAAGGVGQAAIAVALRAGARVLATAHPRKHAFVRSRGVSEVYSSRDLAFAAQVRAATGGRGVDVVLNSLGGEALAASLELLAAGGRFLEIGKLDSLSADEVARRRPDVRYLPFDLGEAARAEPALLPALFAEICAGLEDGSLPRLPATVFAVEDAVSAFALLARSGHLGKVVLRHPGAPLVRPERAVLITGGLGALGLVAARALVAAGARRLVLASRSAPSSEAEQAIAALREAGAAVDVVRGDVASREDVARIIAAAPDIGGVIHAAGVLDDAAVSGLDVERALRVAAPKVQGARHLSAALEGRSLDFFVSFTSAAGVLGSAGQAAYAAANAALAGEMASRRSAGQPGLALAFGAWGERGMAARLAEPIKKRMREGGLREIEPGEGAALLRAILERGAGAAEVALLPVHWPRFLARPGAAQVPLYEAFRGAAQPVAARRGGPEVLLGKLAAAEPGDRPALIAELLASELAAVIGLGSPDEVDRSRKLSTMGVDSLLAVDLRNRLESSVGRKLPASLLFDHPTIEDLALHLSRELDKASGAAVKPVVPPPAPSVTAEPLDAAELPSEDELTRRLEAQLERMQRG